MYCVTGASESAISDMQAYMDMLNPDIGSDMPKKNEIPADVDSKLPPPPTYPPPPPPQSQPVPPPPPSYPAPQPPKEPSSAEFLTVKSNLRHVENKKEVSVSGILFFLKFSLDQVIKWFYCKNSYFDVTLYYLTSPLFILIRQCSNS